MQSAGLGKEEAVSLGVPSSSFTQVSEVSNCLRLGRAACYFMLFAGWMKELHQTFSCDQGLDGPGLWGR